MSPSCSRELRKSSGRPPETKTQQRWCHMWPAGGARGSTDSPSSSLLKDRLVVSSFKFLLKSMHRLLSFFLMFLISCYRGVKVKAFQPIVGPRAESKGHLLGLWGQVEAVPPPQLEQSVQVASGFCVQAAGVQLLLQTNANTRSTAASPTSGDVRLPPPLTSSATTLR